MMHMNIWVLIDENKYLYEFDLMASSILYQFDDSQHTVSSW